MMRIAERPAVGDLDDRRSLLRSRLPVVFVVVSSALIFELDAATGSAPFQHLYYVPIIAAGIGLRRYAGLVTAAAAVVLYHLANPVLLAARYRESDIVQILLFLAIGIVTTRLAEDRRRLQRLSVTDDLTGLYNLRGFGERLTKAIRIARAARTSISLLVLDLDRLKSLNDVHGHLAGADAVRTVGQIIAAQLPPDAFASRFGGDEFVVALPGQGCDAAHETAETLRRAVHATAPRLAGIAFPRETLSISIGVACQRRFDDDSGTGSMADAALGESLFRAADRALYVAKSAGRNQVGRLGHAGREHLVPQGDRRERLAHSRRNSRP